MPAGMFYTAGYIPCYWFTLFYSVVYGRSKIGSTGKAWVLRGEGVYEFGRQAALQLMDLPASQRPTALVCFNDFMAIGAMHPVQSLGLQVGEDIAVTGFDDVPMIQYLTPPLTSLRQPVWEVPTRDRDAAGIDRRTASVRDANPFRAALDRSPIDRL